MIVKKIINIWHGTLFSKMLQSLWTSQLCLNTNCAGVNRDDHGANYAIRNSRRHKIKVDGYKGLVKRAYKKYSFPNP